MDRKYHSTDQALYKAAEVFAALPDAYLILNSQCEVVLANARYLALVGQPLSAIQGRSVYDINQFGSAEQRSARVEWLERTIQGLALGESRTSPAFRYEMPASAPTDKGIVVVRYWTIRATAITLLQSSRSCIAIAVSDVTAQVREAEDSAREKAKLRSQARLRQVLFEEANEKLLEHQEKFTAALEFAEIGAWELDRETGIIDCTAQTMALFGIKSGEALTEERLFADLIDSDDQDRARAVIATALRHREHFELELRCMWPDGSQHWLLVKGVGKYVHSQLSSVIGFTMDITGRKTTELEQSSIAASERQAREQSDAAAQSMDHFVTAVSHELRSPLGAILSWTGLMQRANNREHTARAADVIQRNARQLSHMVDDLLDSGAIATGKLAVNLRPIDFAALTGNVVEDVRPDAEAKGLKLICSRLEPSTVMGDESRLKQVVWNLLSNAMKFCAAGEIEVAVRRDGLSTVLSVRDTGCGIEARKIHKIFERFEQSNKTTPGRVGGLGLGLWLVKNIVDLHHGCVAVESEGPGSGTTFRVNLPICA